MMHYENVGGMHLVWWFFWVIMLVWIFATPWDIPGQRTKKNTPLDILKRRFAAGEIQKDEYEEKRTIIEQN
jgi:putative membrane protein